MVYRSCRFRDSRAVTMHGIHPIRRVAHYCGLWTSCWQHHASSSSVALPTTHSYCWSLLCETDSASFDYLNTSMLLLLTRSAANNIPAADIKCWWGRFDGRNAGSGICGSSYCDSSMPNSSSPSSSSLSIEDKRWPILVDGIGGGCHCGGCGLDGDDVISEGGGGWFGGGMLRKSKDNSNCQQLNISSN